MDSGTRQEWKVKEAREDVSVNQGFRFRHGKRNDISDTDIYRPILNRIGSYRPICQVNNVIGGPKFHYVTTDMIRNGLL